MSDYLAFDLPECHNCEGLRRVQCHKLFEGAISRRRAMNKEFAIDPLKIMKANRVEELLDLSEEVHENEMTTLLRSLDLLQCRLSPDAVVYHMLLSCIEPEL